MQELEKLNQAQLKEYLQNELDAKEPDRTVVLKILELLKERDPVQDIPAKAYESWLELQKDIEKPRQSAWKIWTGIGAVAAVLALILFIVPPAFGAENIFQLVGRWTDSVFSFGEDSDQTDIEFKTDHEGLQQVYDAVQEMGVTANVVPTWLPQGYKLKELITEPYPDGERVTASFAKNEDYIVCSFSYSPHNKEIQIEKEKKDAKCLEINNVKHYVFQNDEYWNVTWVIENSVCIIKVDDYDTLIAVVNSVYKEGE